MTLPMSAPGGRAVDYAALAARIAALTEGETDPIALMATIACEIHHADDRFDWTGFYGHLPVERRPHLGG